MGQIHFEPEEIERIGKLLGKEVSIQDNELAFDIDGAALRLGTLKSEGHVEKNGVRFNLQVSFDADGLKVSFE